MTQPNRLPPDIYPGLDDELNAAYARNVAEGIATPPEEAPEAQIETVVEEQLQEASVVVMPEIIRDWADPQLKDALNTWHKYGTQGLEVPSTTDLLAVKNPNFATTIRRLYSAHQTLIDSGEATPSGENIGETMRLVLIPWRQIMEDIGGPNPRSFFDRLYEMRKVQGIDEPDYFYDDLQEALESDKPIYRDPDNLSALISAPNYLQKKLEQDGDWGIMLVQTSEQAGLEKLKGHSPDQLTNSGTEHLKINVNGVEYDVDSLGIFEWLALTLQEDPKQLSATTDYSWMLANRLNDSNGAPCVPCGDWGIGQVESSLGRADDTDDDMRPRLAVS